MKIILPFVLVFFFFRSRYFPSRINTYPLLSLENFSLFAMQLSIYRVGQRKPTCNDSRFRLTHFCFRSGRVSAFVPDPSSRPSPHVRFVKNVGGLKWTRTFDLTLIRRVL